MNKVIKKSTLLFFITLVMILITACTNDGSKVTINFETNGGQMVQSIEYDGKTNIKMPVEPTKEGFEFLGWYWDKDILEEPFTNETLKNKKISKEVTVYAKWKEKALTYKVTYDTDGGSDIQDIFVNKGNKIGLPETSKTGQKIVGFYTSSAFDVEWNFATDVINEDITLYAKWSVDQFTISFISNEGSNVDDIKLDYNSVVTKPNDPKKAGYTFGGWYTDAALVTRYVFTSMPASNMTLYAKWDKAVLTDVTMTETFETLQNEKDAGNNFSEYSDHYFTGDTYVLWDLTNVRIDLGMKAGENAITLGGFGNTVNDAGMGRIYSSSISDGIKRLQFEGRLPFSPNSTYPQGPGKDKATSVKINVFINDELIETLQFTDDKTASKGQLFTIENLNVIGGFSLSIEVSSGHRLTLDNISWDTNKLGVTEKEPVTIDFEGNRFDFDNDETNHNINGIMFAFKEVHTNVMHPAKELAYMDEVLHGNIIARFRGDKDDYFSTPIAYMYNVDTFDSVKKLSFDARLFGSDTFFGYESEINIYYRDGVTTEWTKLETSFLLAEHFSKYEVEVNKTDVQLKIEVLNGKVNIDNIIFD